LNVTTLLNPSTAEQIPKDQRATTPPWRAVGRVDAPYWETAAWRDRRLSRL